MRSACRTCDGTGCASPSAFVFGILFGFSNGLTMGGVYLMLGRLGQAEHNEKAIKEGDIDAAHGQLRDQQLSIDTQQDHVNTTLKQLDAQPAPLPKDANFWQSLKHNIHEWWTNLTVVHDIGAGAQNLGHQFYLAVDPWLPLAPSHVGLETSRRRPAALPAHRRVSRPDEYATSYCLAWAGQRVSNEIREDVFRKNLLLLARFLSPAHHRRADEPHRRRSRRGQRLPTSSASRT